MKRLILPLLLVIHFIGNAQKREELKNIAIYLQDNVEILDFAGPMEVFIIAGFNVYTVADTPKPLKAMHILTITPDYDLDNAPEPDILVFVGGGLVSDAKDPKIIDWVQKMASKSELQFSVCTGAYFLAEAGLLNNLTATTYHLSIPHLKKEFPEVDVKENVRFVDNGKTITTAGISAGIDGALHVVAKLKGTKYAQYVADAMEYDKWSPGEGLVLTKGIEELVLNQGFEKALLGAAAQNMFNGEFLDLADALENKGNYEDAEKSILHAISNMNSPELTTYNHLRSIRLKQGKQVPPISEEFEQILKNKGIKAAEKFHKEVMKKFSEWIYIDADKIIRSAYLDYFAKGDLKTAKNMVDLLYKIYPKDAYVTYVMGLYEERSNQLKKALTFYNLSLELNPGFHMAKEKIDALSDK